MFARECDEIDGRYFLDCFDVLILDTLHVLLNLFKHTFTEVNLGFPRWGREVQMGEDWVTWETHVAKRQVYHRPLHNAWLEEAQTFPPSRWKVTSLPGTALRFCMVMLFCCIMDFFLSFSEIWSGGLSGQIRYYYCK